LIDDVCCIVRPQLVQDEGVAAPSTATRFLKARALFASLHNLVQQPDRKLVQHKVRFYASSFDGISSSNAASPTLADCIAKLEAVEQGLVPLDLTNSGRSKITLKPSNIHIAEKGIAKIVELD
jgi:hypothetical protein